MLVVEFPGYGLCPGKPSEVHFYFRICLVVNWCKLLESNLVSLSTKCVEESLQSAADATFRYVREAGCADWHMAVVSQSLRCCKWRQLISLSWAEAWAQQWHCHWFQPLVWMQVYIYIYILYYIYIYISVSSPTWGWQVLLRWTSSNCSFFEPQRCSWSATWQEDGCAVALRKWHTTRSQTIFRVLYTKVHWDKNVRDDVGRGFLQQRTDQGGQGGASELRVAIDENRTAWASYAALKLQRWWQLCHLPIKESKIIKFPIWWMQTDQGHLQQMHCS